MLDKLEDYIERHLVDNDIVVINKFFNKYLKIVSSSCTEDVYDEHHIVPRCYFKHQKISVDNSKLNIVRLSIQDHILAHYYLYMCSKESWFKYANLCSIKYFTGRENISEEDLIKILPDIVALNEESRRLNSIQHSGSNHVNYGKHLSEETKNKISKAKKGRFNSNGKLGSKLSEETKEKIRIAHFGKSKGPMSEEHKRAISVSNKGKHKNIIYTDEMRKLMSERRKGKNLSESAKEKIGLAHRNLKWYTNGTINTKCKECPDGYFPGRSNFHYPKTIKRRCD